MINNQKYDYGKIKNNELIVADKIVVVDGKSQEISEEELQKNGYKRIIFNDLIKNKEGFLPKVIWVETDEFIIQKWIYDKIPTDKSGELLVAIRHYDQKLRCSIDCLENNYKKNMQSINNLLEKSPFITEIVEKLNDLHVEDILSYLHIYCKFNLKTFLDSLGLLKDYISKGYVVDDTHLKKGEKIFPITYFKYTLSQYEDLKTYSTIENNAVHDMAYIYSFTIFDEVILKIIRLILMHEKKWLISNMSISAQEILSCNTTNEIHKLLVNKKIEELSWGSYSDKINFLKNHGIVIKKDVESLFGEDLLYISAKRNVIVHNSGKWNKESIKLLQNTKYNRIISEGKEIDRSFESCKTEFESYSKKAIEYLYNEICEKFNMLNHYSFDCK